MFTRFVLPIRTLRHSSSRKCLCRVCEIRLVKDNVGDAVVHRRRYALLYFLPLIIYQILGARNDRAADAAKIAEGGKVPLHDDDDGFTAGRQCHEHSC